jgi:MerR family transcriptional regulator, light-induced transcriptional regulator
MITYSKIPTYNLKVVLQETDIKPDTLRAWERRYGIPMPTRTEGKHRLYSDYDIATIKWLLTRQHEGMSISRAVRLWRTLEEKGKNPLQEIPAPTTPTLLVEHHQVAQPVAPITINGATIDDLRQTWIEACLHYNEPLAEQSLTQAFALYPPHVVCLEVLQKGLRYIGELWYQNKATVQQEHFASALAMRRLNTLVTAAPPPSRPGKIIVGCPANEHHVFSPLFLTLALRHNGWETLYLGANVPREYLENTIATPGPI